MASETETKWAPWLSRQQEQRVRDRVPAHLLHAWTPAPNDKVFIYSREHGAYWRENACGYSGSIYEAGIYTVAEAEEHSGHAGPEKGIEYHPASEDELKRRAAPALYAALEALLEKVHAVDKALQPLYALAHVHGWEYGGPIYEEELKDAAAALAQARGEDA